MDIDKVKYWKELSDYDLETAEQKKLFVSEIMPQI